MSNAHSTASLCSPQAGTTMKDENGQLFRRRETAHDLSVLAATSVPARIAGRWQILSTQRRVPTHPARESSCCAKNLYRIIRTETFQPHCSGFREVKAEKVGPCQSRAMATLTSHSARDDHIIRRDFSDCKAIVSVSANLVAKRSPAKNHCSEPKHREMPQTLPHHRQLCYSAAPARCNLLHKKYFSAATTSFPRGRSDTLARQCDIQRPSQNCKRYHPVLNWLRVFARTAYARFPPHGSRRAH